MNVKEFKEMMEGDSINLTCEQNLSAMFKHSFTQIDNSAEIIRGFTESDSGVQGVAKITADKGACSLICTGMEIRSLKSNMYGFDVTSESLAQIANLFSTPQIIPSQQLDYNAFPIAATAAGIQSTINMPVTNTTCISIMFPKYDNDYTVFENPVYNNLQLTVNGKNMPDEVVSSQGARFLQHQLIAGDLSGGLECTKEFEDR